MVGFESVIDLFCLGAKINKNLANNDPVHSECLRLRTLFVLSYFSLSCKHCLVGLLVSRPVLRNKVDSKTELIRHISANLVSK